MIRALVLSLFIASLAFAGALGARLRTVDQLGSKRATYGLRKDALESPGPGVLRLIALEHASALADVTWLQMLQIIGAETATEEGVADRLERWAYITTDLDPKYYVVYYATAINLVTYAKRVDASDRILRIGRKHLPDRWELLLLLGYNAYFVRGEPAEAAKYWLEASKLPDVPFWLPSLAARAEFHSGARDEAKDLLRTMIKELPEGPQRETMEIRLKTLESEDLLIVYDNACKEFEQSQGRKPTPSELFMTQRVQYPPRDLFGEELFFDANCRARSAMIDTREDEAAKRIGSQGAKGLAPPVDVKVGD